MPPHAASSCVSFRVARGFLLILMLASLTVAPLWVGLAAAQQQPGGVEQQVLSEETQEIRKLVLQSNQFAQRMERYKEYVGYLEGLNVLLDTAGPVLETLREVQDSGAIDLLALAGVLDGSFDVLPQVLKTVEELHAMAEQLAALGSQLKLLTTDIDTLLATEQLSVAQLQSLRAAAIPTGKQALQHFLGVYQQVSPLFSQLDQALASLEQEMNALLGQAFGQLGGLPPSALGGLGGGLGLPSMGDLFGDVKALRAELDDMAQKVPDDIAFLSTLEAKLIDAEAHLAYAQAEQLVNTGNATQAREMLGLISQTYPQSKWSATAQQRIKSLDQADLERATADASGDTAAGALAVVTPGGGVAWWAVLLLVFGACAGGAGAVHWLQRRRSAPAK